MPPEVKSGTGKDDADLWPLLGKIGTVLGLCAFAFGIGTFSDLKHHLTPDVVSSSSAYQRSYVEAVEDECATATKDDGKVPDPVTYAWMNDILTLRRAMAKGWGLVPVARGYSWSGQATKVRWDFLAADAYWAATADALKASDVTGFNTNLGLFDSATATFLAEAGAFGLKNCAYQWPTVSPWQVQAPR
jgi:hypothetical protein